MWGKYLDKMQKGDPQSLMVVHLESKCKGNLLLFGDIAAVTMDPNFDSGSPFPLSG